MYCMLCGVGSDTISVQPVDPRKEMTLFQAATSQDAAIMQRVVLLQDYGDNVVTWRREECDELSSTQCLIKQPSGEVTDVGDGTSVTNLSTQCFIKFALFGEWEMARV